MSTIRTVWEVLSADGFWAKVRQVRWSLDGAGPGASTGTGASLRLRNASTEQVELVGVVLVGDVLVDDNLVGDALVDDVVLQGPSDGPHGTWRPADGLVPATKKDRPAGPTETVLRPAETGLRPAETVRLLPGQEVMLPLPPTVTPRSGGSPGAPLVAAVVLRSVEGKAVKQWRLDAQGQVEILRDDKVGFTPGSLLDGVLSLFGGRG